MLKKYKKKRSSFKNVFDEIKNCDNYDEISETIFFKFKLTSYEFYEAYKDIKTKRKFDEKTKNFLDAVVARLRKFEEIKLQSYVSFYRPLLLSFFESDCLEVTEYFKDKKVLEKALEFAYIIDYELYSEFFDVLEKKKIALRKMHLTQGVEIVNAIENGVQMSDGSFRDFDIIDYYTITKLEPKKMVFILRKYSDSPRLLGLKKFANRNENDYKFKKEDIERRLLDRTIFNCEFDDEGRVIPNTGFEISDADKFFVLDFLREIDVPITELTYSAGLRRFRNGVFKHEESKNKEFVLK